MDRHLWTRKHQLDRMTHRDLVHAYCTHPAILTYGALGAVCLSIAAGLAEAWLPLVSAAAAVVLVYPFVWYALHRFVLHGAWLYRRPATARLWKRIHFDHHRDPHDLRVLFGALYTTLPTVLVVVAPIGYMMGGVAAAAAAFATGLVVTCVYEYCHCIQHLPYVPRWSFLRRIKKRHLQHHFVDERSNYGITSFLPDRLFATYREHPAGAGRSPTVFNLGYMGDEVRRFPWVARLTPELNDNAEAAVPQPIRRADRS